MRSPGVSQAPHTATAPANRSSLAASAGAHLREEVRAPEDDPEGGAQAEGAGARLTRGPRERRRNRLQGPAVCTGHAPRGGASGRGSRLGSPLRRVEEKGGCLGVLPWRLQRVLRWSGRTTGAICESKTLSAQNSPWLGEETHGVQNAPCSVTFSIASSAPELAGLWSPGLCAM